MTGIETAAIVQYASIASTVLEVAGGISDAFAARSTGKRNAQILEAQALQRQQEAQARSDMRRRENEQLRSRQRLQMARSGADPGSGSFLELGSETESYGLMDELTILRGGAAESALLRNRASAQREAGSTGFVSGLLGAGGSALSGASMFMPAPNPANKADENYGDYVGPRPLE